MSYLQLGTVRLDLITHVESFEGTLGYAYASHDIIEGKSHLQWTGDQLEARSLACMLHVRWCDPQAEFLKLKQAAEQHKALRLFFANGTYEGHYVIEELQKTLTQTDRQGNIYLMHLRVQLREYVEAANKSGSWRILGGGTSAMGGLGGLIGSGIAGQVVGTALAIASNPRAFAMNVARNFAGNLGGQIVGRMGPLGPEVSGVYNAIARQKVDSVLR